MDDKSNYEVKFRLSLEAKFGVTAFFTMKLQVKQHETNLHIYE